MSASPHFHKKFAYIENWSLHLSKPKFFVFNGLNLFTTKDLQMQFAYDAANVLVEDNMDLAVAHVVKYTCETALNEMKKCLDKEIMSRRAKRAEGRTHAVLMEFPGSQQLPNKIRPYTGQITPNEMIVYNGFSKLVLPSLWSPFDLFQCL